MCYSAQIRAEYSRYLKQYGAELSLKEYFDLFWRRVREAYKIKVPRSMELVFTNPQPFTTPQTDHERAIKALIDEFNVAEANRLEQELFKQRKRLADAERALQTKATKKAAEDKRIATDKVQWALGKLAALRRTEPEGDDLRIFPGWYAPVMVMENGKRVVKPMRYQCRPAGKPAAHDTQFPGTYNARRDNLEGYWRNLFGHTHGVMFADAFFENVKRDGVNVVLEFKPRPAQDMLVACLWSRWTAPGEPDLLSFAAITDEPPAEVAAAGHDRCIIPIKPERVDAWLNPDPKKLRALYDILDDRERPYYEHRLAA
jgi:putative SOS response-associated peptidase YedK